MVFFFFGGVAFTAALLSGAFTGATDRGGAAADPVLDGAAVDPVPDEAVAAGGSTTVAGASTVRVGGGSAGLGRSAVACGAAGGTAAALGGAACTVESRGSTAAFATAHNAMTTATAPHPAIPATSHNARGRRGGCGRTLLVALAMEGPVFSMADGGSKEGTAGGNGAVGRSAER